MAENSKIEWCHHTMNFWLGCTALSPACEHCYAEAWSKRAGKPELWQGFRQRTSEDLWKKPAKWDARCAAAGIRERVFTNSLADFFDNQAQAEWRHDAWQVIAGTPNLDWMPLTKRPQNIPKMLPPDWGEGWHNVWLGTTIEDRERLKNLDYLRAVPARIRFLSIEPLLEDLGEIDLTGIHLVIVGGESGPGARLLNPDWVRSLRDHCAAQGVAFFFKQWGEWLPGQNEIYVGWKEPHADRDRRIARWQDRSDPARNAGFGEKAVLPQRHRAGGYVLAGDRPYGPGTGFFAMRVGKKAAGRLLDGVEHNGMPEVRT